MAPRLTVVPDDGADPDVPGEPAPDDGPTGSTAPLSAATDPPSGPGHPEAAADDPFSAAADPLPAVADRVPAGADPLTAAGVAFSAAEEPAAGVGADGAAGATHDAGWFEDLVRTHTRALHRYLVRRVGVGDADDLAADVLVVAWRRRDDVPDEAPLAWLYRTAGFVVANFRRKGRPIPVGDLPDEVADDDPAVHAVRDEQVRDVLRRLSPRDRQIVLLNAWEGLAGDDLAAVLGIGRGGADAALSRARARLAAAWSELA